MRGTTETSRLQALEQAWRPRVEGISLLAELEVGADEIDEALEVIGLAWQTSYETRWYRRMRASYPATFAVALSGAASIYYEGGKYWPSVFEAAGVYGDGNVSRSWGMLFVECLQALGLDDFPQLEQERAQKYVSRILLHAGVPVYCMQDLLTVIDQNSDGGELDSAEVYERLHHRALAKRLYIDKPAQRFLVHGGDYALDFLDRTIELTDALRAGGSPPAGLGLPQRYIDNAVELIKEEADRPLRRRATTNRRGLARPHLAFDATGIGVHLVLPSLESDSRVRWRVSFDGEPSTFEATVNSSGVSEAIELPLPMRVASLEVAGPDVAWREDLATGTGAMLVFGQDGRAIPRASHLPGATVWVVHPADADLEHDGQIRGRLPSVHRWDGWVATQLDLTRATHLGLEGGRRRSIDTSARPALTTQATLGDATTVDGQAIHTQWPTLALPPSGGTPWSIKLQSGQEPEVVRVQEVSCEEWVQIDLADLAEASSGVHALTVRGPLGRGLKRSLTVVPGAQLTTSPSWRSFGPKGLTPSMSTLRQPGQDDKVVRLGDGEIDARMSLPVDTGTVDLVLRPAGMASQIVREGEPVQWSHSTRQLVTESLIDDPGRLVVRTDPDAAAPVLELRDGDGNIAQVVTGTAYTSTVSFNLARIADSLRSLRAGSLVLGGNGRRDVVAHIRPGRLADDIVGGPAGATLQVIEPAAGGLTAGIYQHLDPLAAPVLGMVNSDGVIALPDELISVGDLRVVLRIEDPWVPQPWGAFPWTKANVFDVECMRPLEPANTAQRLMMGYPLTGADDLSSAVATYRLVDRILDVESAHQLRSRIRRRTDQDPTATLRAIAATDSSTEDVAFASVNLGAISRPISRMAPDEVEQLLDRWAPLGVVAATSLLRSSDRGWFPEVISAKVGAAFIDLLEGRDHASVHQPTFDNAALLKLPDEVIDAAFRDAGIAPSLLLEVDQRALAGRRLLTAIRDDEPVLRPLKHSWMDYVGGALDMVIRPHAPKSLADAVLSRVGGADWQSAPAASLALATVARLDSRVHAEDRRLRPPWRFALGRLARCAPSLVAGDLIIAEAMLLSQES